MPNRSSSGRWPFARGREGRSRVGTALDNLGVLSAHQLTGKATDKPTSMSSDHSACFPPVSPVLAPAASFVRARPCIAIGVKFSPVNRLYFCFGHRGQRRPSRRRRQKSQVKLPLAVWVCAGRGELALIRDAETDRRREAPVEAGFDEHRVLGDRHAGEGEYVAVIQWTSAAIALLAATVAFRVHRRGSRRAPRAPSDFPPHVGFPSKCRRGK